MDWLHEAIGNRDSALMDAENLARDEKAPSGVAFYAFLYTHDAPDASLHFTSEYRGTISKGVVHEYDLMGRLRRVINVQ